MPKNNSLESVELPMIQKWNYKPRTEFVNNLRSIKIKLLSYPTIEQLCSYLLDFSLATWSEKSLDNFENCCEKTKMEELKKIFFGKALPTALETVNLVFLIDGISLQEVTHILRHRLASFSADCSGDKWWTNKRALVPNSIQNSDRFYKRYEKIVKDAKQLYCDMVDSKKISIMDARYIFPRCLETYYFMRMNFRDTMNFIRQRKDRQVQPETDNIISYLMWYELLKVYPFLDGLIDLDEPSYFYVKMARTGKATNLYFPEENSDKFEWNEKDFIYQCERDKLNGTNKGAKNLFNKIKREIFNKIQILKWFKMSQNSS